MNESGYLAEREEAKIIDARVTNRMDLVMDVLAAQMEQLHKWSKETADHEQQIKYSDQIDNLAHRIHFILLNPIGD